MNEETQVRIPSAARTAGRLALVGLCEFAFGVLGTVTIYYYKPPIWALALLILIAAGAVWALVCAIRGAHRRVLTTLGALGITVVVLAVVALLSYVMPSPIMGRVKQMASSAGFTILLPPGEKLEAKDRFGYEPSTTLENGEFTAHYRRFDVWERKSDVPLAGAALEAVAAQPQPDGEAQTTIETDSSREVSVLGQPALAVEWHEAMAGKTGGRGAVLVFQPAGALIKLTSEATDATGLTIDELVKLAATFEPVK